MLVLISKMFVTVNQSLAQFFCDKKIINIIKKVDSYFSSKLKPSSITASFFCELQNEIEFGKSNFVKTKQIFFLLSTRNDNKLIFNL